MGIYEFVRNHRVAIDEFIKIELGREPQFKNDNERRLWLLNCEPLYQWAKGEGVNI